MATKKPAQRPATRATAQAQLLATSGAALRTLREKGIVLTFPSGNNYRVCLPGAAGMLRRGNLPNPLLSFVTSMFYNPSIEKYDAFLATKDDPADALALMESFKVTCEAMFLDPMIVDTPQADNEAAIEDIPLEDQVWAFRLLFAPVEAVYPFRGESKADVVGVQRPETVTQATE